MHKTHKPTFNQSRATLLVAANSIGTGIFTTTGFLLADLKSPWLVLSVWILGAVYSLLGVFSYATLHQVFPGSGGEYHFLSKAFHPYVGVGAGFVTIVAGFTAPLAAASMAFSVYFLRAVPLNISSTGLAVLVMSFVFLFHFISHQKGMRWHDLFVYGKLLFFFLLIGICFFVADWQWPQTTESFSIWTYARSFFWVAYAYSGWNAVYYIASELTTNESNVNRASYLGTSLVSILYVVLNVPLLFGMNTQRLEGVAEVMAVYFAATTGYSVERSVSFIIAMGLISTMSAFLLIVPRIYSRMAEDKILPEFFYFLPGHHPRRVFFVQYVSTIIVIVFIDFATMLHYAGFVLTVCSFFSVAGLYFARKIHLSWLQYMGTIIYVVITALLILLGGPWFANN
ncbi:MAG: amino acid permease [Bdellovibrionaceae bacterium]|nr:amino acid permease [Pseudobdellovibrionaceae bacterium]